MRPYYGWTVWHIAVVCSLVVMATRLTAMPAAEYTAADRRAMDELVARALHATAEPIVLTKDGFVVYDSGTRAEVIADVLNITPQNIDSYREWFR